MDIVFLFFFLSNFASGRTIPTHSTGPQPIQLVPKHCFYRYLGNGGSSQKISKTKFIYFLILLLGGPSPPSQLVPNPFNWSPNTVFLQISQYRSLKSKKFKKKQSTFLLKFCFWEDSPHPVNWSPTHSTGPQTPFFLQISWYGLLKSKKLTK